VVGEAAIANLSELDGVAAEDDDLVLVEALDRRYLGPLLVAFIAPQLLVLR
jgi:hypothetical protein